MKRVVLVIAVLTVCAFAQNNLNDFRPFGGGATLSINVNGGVAAIGTTPTAIVGKSVALTANATNYVYVDLVGGTITSNTTGFTSTTYPIAVAITNATQVTSLTDSRPGAYVTSASGGTGFPVTAAQLVSTGGSISPTGTGQLGASQVWTPKPLIAATLTLNVTGGSMGNGVTVFVVYTLNSAAGETNPSVETSVVTASCTGGNQCSVTVTAPTIPSGFTGYTVYSIGSLSNYVEQKQAGCTNITIDCTFGVANGAGAVVANANTAWTGPTPLAASECPPDVIPSMFIMDTAGTYHTQAGVTPYFHATAGPPSPGGTWLICRRTEFNDDKLSPTIGKNAMVTMNHNTGVGTVLTNQDRALWVSVQNPVGDAATRYAIEAIQDQLIFNGNPTINGSPDGEVTAHSVQAQDSHTGALSAPTAFGFNGVRISVTRPGAGSWSGCQDLGCLVGERVEVVNNNTATLGGGWLIGHSSKVRDISGAPTGANGMSYYAVAPPGGTRLNVNYGYYAGDFGTNPVDFALNVSSASTNASQSFFGGPVWFGQPLWGTISPRQITTPTNSFSIVRTCVTTCTATYVYKLVAKDLAGGWAPATTTITTAVGATTLDGSNFNTITMGGLPPNLPAGGTQGNYAYDVYRTSVTGGSPSTVGYLGTVICPTSSFTCSFVDNGVAISSPTTSDYPTPPAYNASGSLTSYAYRTITNCKVNSASPAACAAAPAGSFVVPTTTTTYTVNTSIVSINSEIFLMPTTDATGMAGGPTCVAPAITSAWAQSARTAGTSFTFTLPSTTGTTCWHYWIVN